MLTNWRPKYARRYSKRHMIHHILGPLLCHCVGVGHVADETVLQVVKGVLIDALAQSNHLVVGYAVCIVALFADKAAIAVGVESRDVDKGLEFCI